jgi:peptide/nickel transport system substrate-binding protein
MRILRSLLLTTSLIASIALAACTNTPHAQNPIPGNVQLTVTPQPQRQPVLRVATFGDVTTTNVWSLFDDVGANYWNYATQSDYWPRLYQLSPFTQDIEPGVAQGEISAMVCESTVCTATIKLLPDLTWTDGTPLTAHDVAFTANTALRFRLGLAWGEAYNSDFLDRVEALDDSRIQYFFKEPPGVATWQYGVLQGPIVNQAYWEPRIVEASLLLPDEEQWQLLQELQQQSQDMSAQVESLGLSLNTMAPSSQIYQNTASQATRIQEDLNSVNNRLAKIRNEYELQMADARQALFALGNASEPTLGPWKFESRISGVLKNSVELGTPFGNPWFDNVQYIKVADETSAVELILADEIDVILTPSGLSPQSVMRLNAIPEVSISRNSSRKARFLAFNQANPYLADVALRKAIACLLAPEELIKHLNGEAAALTGFTLEGSWHESAATLPCQGESSETRLAKAIQLLKAAGYTWEQEPGPAAGPIGLKTPDGSMLPAFNLLAPATEYDSLRASTAVFIAQQAQLLGINVKVQLSEMDAVLYAVYGSRDYDMALLGWQLSSYPDYMCDWFIPAGENLFAYGGSRLANECEAWGQTTNIGQAHAHASEVQSILMADLPLVPLYAEIHYDAYRNIRYPFNEITDGLAGLYGGPDLAIPIP